MEADSLHTRKRSTEQARSACNGAPEIPLDSVSIVTAGQPFALGRKNDLPYEPMRVRRWS